MSSEAGGQPRIAYLGPAGTFTEEAALLYRPDAELLPMPTVAAVASAVASSEVDEGVVPIENSLEGTVTATVDTLIHESRLAVCGEIILPIDHCFLVRPGRSAESVQVVYSHPQALAQCRRYLERSFPEARQEASLSTAAAVEQMMQVEDAAAIATQRAAELYGAEVLERGIQDNPANRTRFAVLGLSDNTPTGADKTSLAFSVAHDRPGTLVSVLHEFSDRDINLTKIESRPSKEELGIYIFLVDLEGHRSDPIVAEALAAVRQKAFFFKVFGSYPRHRDA